MQPTREPEAHGAYINSELLINIISELLIMRWTKPLWTSHPCGHHTNVDMTPMRYTPRKGTALIMCMFCYSGTGVHNAQYSL